MSVEAIVLAIIGGIGTATLGLIAYGIRSLVASVIESNKQIAILTVAVKDIQLDIETLFKLNGINKSPYGEKG